MRTLKSVFADSLAIWSRNFALMYIILLYSLLMVTVWPQELPAWEWRWGLLLLLVVLITAAFMAGWFNMIAAACQRYYTRQQGRPMDMSTTVDAFSLFGEFLPGISRYFVPFAGGWLIQALVIFLIFLAMQDPLAANRPLLEKMMDVDPANREAFMRSLGREQLIALGELTMYMLAGLTVYGIYTLLTMFWPGFVILYGKNVLEAFGRSMLQFFRDPLRVLAIALFYLALQILLSLLMSVGTVMFLMAQFFSLMIQIYMAILLFVYLGAAVGRPSDWTPGKAAVVQEPGDDAPDNP